MAENQDTLLQEASTVILPAVVARQQIIEENKMVGLSENKLILINELDGKATCYLGMKEKYFS